MIVEGDEKMDDIILVQPVRIIQQDSSDYGEWEREILACKAREVLEFTVSYQIIPLFAP